MTSKTRKVPEQHPYRRWPDMLPSDKDDVRAALNMLGDVVAGEKPDAAEAQETWLNGSAAFDRLSWALGTYQERSSDA